MDRPDSPESELFRESDDGLVHVLPVPFDATCSYGRGTARAWQAIRAASGQLDLEDPDFGPVHASGIHVAPASPDVLAWNDEAGELARAVVADPEGPEAAARRKRVDELSAMRTRFVADWTRETLSRSRVPAILGGDHSCPLGAIGVIAQSGPVSILHVDAHLDMRDSYQGFRESHASIMCNVLRDFPNVTRLVSIGVRDYATHELERARSYGARVRVIPMSEWDRQLFAGTPFADLVRGSLAGLSDQVYVSFDIDGLEPHLCPGTGTPVPGGLDFHQAAFLLAELTHSGRSVVGFDLCEVGGTEPDRSSPDAELGANVAARVLYKLCGAAIRTRG